MSNLLIDDSPLSDFVVAKGKSGSWHYIKYANGFAECWMHWAGDKEIYTSSGPTGFPYGYYFEFTFPFEFYEIPTVVCVGSVKGSFSTTFFTDGSVTKNDTGLYIASDSNATSATVNLRVKGLWKSLA